MNHSIEKNEQYALIRLAETEFGGEVPTAFETATRSLIREGYSNLIIDMASVKSIDTAGFGSIRKINRQCANELGIMVLVSKDDNLIDSLEDIADLTILPTVEEAIDAVFMNDLENDFRNDDDEYDGEYGAGQEPEQ
ncbi:STAS domain-containing protein [Rudanella lutea]|uniref:STAS domain-containing protein n=1 Tax=Rudanella lutea TaxID=451374 RepID=UPI000378E203|nr:STAS domain-containing protein [Rudanella lutea]